MKVFLAGAAGVIGRRLTPLLIKAGHHVTGTTRTDKKVEIINRMGAVPVVVDVFDAGALRETVAQAAPDLVIHQLTDLPFPPTDPRYQEGLARNARLRIDGTENLVAAAKAAGIRRMVAQSIGFIYAEGKGARVETDPLSDAATMAQTIAAVRALEQAVAAMPEGLVLRYGFLYGPGTWSEDTPRPPAVHVDAAAKAALLGATRGAPGIYNIAEGDSVLSSAKAVRELGFDPAFRITAETAG